MTEFPSASFACPLASRHAAPELIRWINPFEATPSGLCPVTRSHASGLQYVRTSWKHGAEPEIRFPRSIAIPLHVSFSVANGVGAFGPFQSNVEAKIASVKSAFGSQSVHCLCPWKPPATAFRPSASSCHPSSSRRGFP